MLNNKQGGAQANFEGDGEEKGLDDIIKKKKVEIFNMNPKHLVEHVHDFKNTLSVIYKTPLGEYSDFQIELPTFDGGKSITLLGKARFVCNDFTKMPRGQVTLNIGQMTLFKKDAYTHFKDIVFMFSKEASQMGEVLQYKVSEHALEPVKFDTYHYDDFIQIDMF